MSINPISNEVQPKLLLAPILMTDQGLRRTVSDSSSDRGQLHKDINLTTLRIAELEKAECECCGLCEECTHDYVGDVKDFHCGKWLCGLCAAAVKEQLNTVPRKGMDEALNSHMEICKKFNNTIRTNPKLSLAGAMREIAKRSSQLRNSKNLAKSGLARSSSCSPSIDVETERLK